MTAYRGSFDGSGLRVAVAVARFNDLVTSRLAEGCQQALERHGVSADAIDTAEVPGARELPVACAALANTGRYAAIVAVGCVIRGETSHFEWVAQEASRGIAEVGRATGIPVIFGVLTTENLEQALERAGGKMGNAGWDAGVAAVEMANLLERIEKGEG
jgi:6,7-dimethyl-8-ribityllumazine synthase